MPREPLRGLTAWVAVAALSAGCSLAPRYERPKSPVAGQWSEASSAELSAATGADLGWRSVFNDARLNTLVSAALRNNRDLRVAALNVELTRAQYRIQRSQLMPNVAASANAEFSDRGPLTFREGIFTTYTVGVGVTDYELDLFGRVRNLKEAALEQYLATEEARRSTQLSLIAEVASQYLIERALDEQLTLARRTVEAVRASLEITRRTFESGQRSELDLSTAQAQLHTAESEVARLTRERAQAQNALVQLLGQQLPGSLPEPQPLAEHALRTDIPAGLPSHLLQRRPDILAAEHTLKSANANIGAARAAFFPRISLTAFAGTASTELSGLFSSGSGIWSFSPSISVPLFTGGRNEANLDVAHVRKRIEVARYESAIQVAFREVADALVARKTLSEQLEAQTARVRAEQRRFELSELRYRTGIENYLAVLTAQQDLYTAEQQLIDTRLARLTNAIELYKALGGGWRS